MKAWQEALGSRVLTREPVRGGCINKAYHCRLEDGREVFVKSHASADPSMFALEAQGLTWLAEADALPVPKVLAHGADFLILEYIAPGRKARSFDEKLGHGLAKLHQTSPEYLGWHQDNFLATLVQDNRPCQTWIDFYLERRLRPQVSSAIDKDLAPPGWLGDLDRLYQRLPEILGDSEPPARLHGDLWSGNVHVGSEGQAVLIDPAVYGGHREVDLAMLELFGSPGAHFYGAYQEQYPLQSGYQERRPLYQLYPLLVHLHLFGGGYLNACETAMQHYL